MSTEERCKALPILSKLRKEAIENGFGVNLLDEAVNEIKDLGTQLKANQEELNTNRKIRYRIEEKLKASQQECERLEKMYSKENMLNALMEVLYIEESFCASQRVHGIYARVTRKLKEGE